MTTPIFDRLGLGINGLDHVRVLVRDLEAAKDCYRDVLGFRVPARGDNYRHPLGSYQTVTRLTDAFYLELLAVNDRATMSRGRPEMVQWLDRREGGHSVLLNVRSAQAAASALQSHGLEVTPPFQGGFEPSGEDGPLDRGWWLVNFTGAPFTREALSLIEYRASWTEQQSHARSWTDHPNGALGVRAVWLAVCDLASAAGHFASLGLTRQQTCEVDALGARACEVRIGERQNVLLITPRADDTAAGAFLIERGQAGVMGVTIEVDDLPAQAQRLTSALGSAARWGEGRYGRSIVVPGLHAHGLWLEFVARG